MNWRSGESCVIWTASLGVSCFVWQYLGISRVAVLIIKEPTRNQINAGPGL